MGLESTQTGKADYGLLADISLTSNFPIAKGWCSPAPAQVHERSKP
jgi:hypothetical protein